ncbi:MAG: DUF2124 family protein [Methanomassiliicoccales archaeon]|nr:DUF2124 family protein [Methanomassiliicoccales archaeon]
MAKVEGITGLTKLFRESITAAPNGGLVVFLGSEAVCSPFAQLLAYAVRDRKMSFCFSPKAIWDKCSPMTWVEGVGYQVSKGKVDLSVTSVIVVLGGLAIPKFGCPVEEVNSFISKVLRKPLIVGVGFMDVFQHSGWDSKISFDAMINVYMSAEMV